MYRTTIDGHDYSFPELQCHIRKWGTDHVLESIVRDGIVPRWIPPTDRSETYLKRIIEKMGVRNRTQAAVQYMEWKRRKEEGIAGNSTEPKKIRDYFEDDNYSKTVYVAE